MEKKNGSDQKGKILTYGFIAAGLVVGLVMKNIVMGLIVGLGGICIADYIDKRNK